LIHSAKRGYIGLLKGLSRIRAIKTLHTWHSSDIRNTRIFWRCSKRSIFKYFKIWKCEYVKYVNTMSKTLSKLSKLSLNCAQTQRQRWSSIFKYFLKSPKKRIIRVCLNRIESMSLLWYMVTQGLIGGLAKDYLGIHLRAYLGYGIFMQ